MESDTPLIPLALVLWLEKHHPDRVPDANTPEYEKCALAGQQQIIRKLRRIYNQQQEGDTDN